MVRPQRSAEEGLAKLLAGRGYGELDHDEQKRIGKLFEESYRKSTGAPTSRRSSASSAAFFHLA